MHEVMHDEVTADGAEAPGPTEASSDAAEQELADAEQALEGAWLAARTALPDRPLRFRVQFTADQEYVDLLEEAFELLGFGKKASNLPEVQLRALRELVERLRKQKRARHRSWHGGPPPRRGARQRRSAPRRRTSPRRGSRTQRNTQ